MAERMFLFWLDFRGSFFAGFPNEAVGSELGLG